jgi:hypothetical protein
MVASRVRVFPFAVLVAVAGMAGCKASDILHTFPPGTGNVVFANTATNAGPIDVYLDSTSTKLVSGLAFLHDTALAGVAGGPHVLLVYPAGSTTGAIATNSAHVSNGITYDFIVAGNANGAQFVGGQNTTASVHLATAAGFRVFSGIDPTTLPPDSVAGVDVYLTDPSGDISVAPYVFSGITQFGSYPGTPPAYGEIVPGSYRMVVTQAQVTTARLLDTAFTVAAGDVRTVTLTDSPTSGAVVASILRDH